MLLLFDDGLFIRISEIADEYIDFMYHCTILSQKPHLYGIFKLGSSPDDNKTYRIASYKNLFSVTTSFI